MSRTLDLKTQTLRAIMRRFIVLIPLTLVLAVASYLYIRSVASRFSCWTPVSYEEIDFSQFGPDDVTVSTPGVVEVESVDYGANGSANLNLRAVADGETEVTFGNEALHLSWPVRVRNGAIIVNGKDFSGWQAVHLSICVLMGVSVVLLGSALVRLVREAWYGYEMVAIGGAFIFLLFETLLFVMLFVRSSPRGFTDLTMDLVYMADYFAYVAFPPMGLLAFLVSLSNISLIRHEGVRPVNFLGIAIGIFWLAAMRFWWRLPRLLLGNPGLRQLFEVVDSSFAVAFTYGECLLLSVIVCAWLAARHVPTHAADYLVILGCAIRKDGTPCPLLAGRVDRARDFDESRVKAGDAPATYVPSGGQGPDEVMSEAESMGNYLVGKGIGSERIVLEDRATTTNENMAFSREVIERHAGRDINEVSVVFSTTNYHVFRGYVCANKAGYVAEGIGAKTKYYFWPNAFLREFAGLLVAKWKNILATYIALDVVYLFAEYVLNL